MEKVSLTAPISVPKPVKITLRIFLGIIAAALSAWLVLTFVSTRITFKYVNGSFSPENEQSCKINYPFFGNSTVLAGGANVYNVPVYLDDMTMNNLISTYDAVNDPIFTWAFMLRHVYGSRGNIDYAVEERKDTLTVRFTGELYDESGNIAENVDKEFIFDIKGASIHNPPKWINKTADDDYFMSMEFLK